MHRCDLADAQRRRLLRLKLECGGQKQLAVETSQWETLARAIARVLRPA